MLFLTAMFFMMSNNNHVPNSIIVGPDGTMERAPTELDRAEKLYGEYNGYLNGTNGTWAPVSRISHLLV